jgi:tripartite-type tricarboxylate transporter receptor subunit TctC
VAPSLYKDLRYDPVKSFAPVSMVSTSPFILLANPALHVNSMADFLALARSKPGKLNYGTTGVGAGPYLAAQMMINETKIDIRHVPYNGSGPLLAAVLGDFVDVGFGDPSALSSIRAGSLKALGVTSLKRSPILPDVPSFNETIGNNFDIANWSSILAPANTPPEIVQFINESIAKALKSPELLKAFDAQGFEPTPSSPEQLRDFMISEIKKYHDVLQAAGVQPQ